MPDGQIRLSKAQRLRQQASEMRRAARVPTTGGHGERILLLTMAERLERDAARLERQADELDAAERLFERKP